MGTWQWPRLCSPSPGDVFQLGRLQAQPTPSTRTESRWALGDPRAVPGESSWRGPNALPMSPGARLGRASDPGLLGKVDEKRTSQTSHAKGRLCPCGCRERKGSGQSWRVGRVGASCSGGDEDEAGRRPRRGNPPRGPRARGAAGSLRPGVRRAGGPLGDLGSAWTLVLFGTVNP